MHRGDKSTSTDKAKRRAGGTKETSEAKGVSRPAAAARAVHKGHGEAGKIPQGRKVPYGPVGGSGRKTNLSRSS